MMLKADIVIAGGGLAGLGLAKQIKTQSPDRKIVVIEKQTFPRPRAVAKVGESTVEIGTRYLSHTLGLEEHLQSEHLRKFGLRMFFGSSEKEFSDYDELGPSQNFGIATYQIDRGDLENQLFQQLIDLDVTILHGANIDSMDIGVLNHSLVVHTKDQHYELTSRWIVDAAGRASLLKNKLNLAESNGHRSNAVWFRVDRRIELDDWSANKNWQARCTPEGNRWLSTNHLAGPGYWVWVIPLASGVTSIGIVMDDQVLEECAIDCEHSALSWLRKHHRRCAEAIDGAKFLDFVKLKDYSYGCKRLFSEDGWAITGEAGFFTDPFYSPGSDFIAFANHYIADIVTSDFSGEDIRFKALLFEKIFRSIYRNTLSLYVDQYGGFGDRCMMGLKMVWDQSYYWGVLALLYFQEALTDISVLRKVNPVLEQSQKLNQKVQSLFRERAKKRFSMPCRGVFLDQFNVPCLQYFNQKMHLPPLSFDDLENELKGSTEKLQELAVTIEEMLSRDLNEKSHSGEALLGEFGGLLTV